jgi:glycerate-2-kinase
MQKFGNKKCLTEIWSRALFQVSPERLFNGERGQGRWAGVAGEALLFWGKAAARTAELLASPEVPALVIRPENYGVPKGGPGFRGQWLAGEHPLPGVGSFQAGAALLDFMDSLRRQNVKKLKVFLSGGASSTAWVPTGGMSPEVLLPLLQGLQQQSMSIAELNQERAKYCVLKGGGAARWLHRFAPKTRAEVYLISDVFPFGPEVVGSGPFFDGKIKHHILAENPTLIQAFAQIAAHQGIPIVHAASGSWGHWTRWLEHLKKLLSYTLQSGQSGLILLGGEPQMDLPSTGGGRGGRMTHLAAALARETLYLLKSEKIEILCASSDGVDGASGSAGAYLTASSFADVNDSYSRERSELQRALRSFDSASLLGRWNALLPRVYTGTNVQDLIAIRVF